MRRRWWLSGVAALLVAGLAAGCESVAYDQAYEQTPLGDAQVRSLPARRWIQTEAPGQYFNNSDRLFGRLFDFIQSNDIAMTVPVESDLEPSAMRFYVADEAAASVSSRGSVRVVDVPARQVASLAAKGSYTDDNVGRVRDELLAWVTAAPQWRADGEAYAVFWNGPFTPGFMKRFEVHVPVRASE